MCIEKATYSPEDNKIRLYPVARLDKELYNRVKAAGYIWAPQQKIFVGPKWTPEREDLALELAGEIKDEDMTLEERAEERAERFESYSERRESEGERTQASVSALADNIPLGQPILVGHHSERKARKDAERIRNGMNKAINLFETAEYWKRRANGAIRHAKYKELPEVRARRIKTLEAEQRKHQKEINDASKFVAAWQKEGLTAERARSIANYDRALPYGTYSSLEKGETTPEQARDLAVEHHTKSNEYRTRCVNHLKNRLVYERTMLEESGYVEPKKERSKKASLPLLNLRGKVSYKDRWKGETHTVEVHPMTKAEYARIHKDCTGTETSADGTHRLRCAILPGGNYTYGGKRVIVFLTDSKEHERPTAEQIQNAKDEQETSDDLMMARRLSEAQERATKDTQLAPIREEAKGRRERIEQLKEVAKAGVVVAVAPQLFPTPSIIVNQMVDLADIGPYMTVLEPSAGTGNIVRAIKDREPTAHIDVIEINAQLCKGLEGMVKDRSNVACADFLTCSPPFCPDSEHGFDRILMNPPFENGSDIAHIKHALTFLKARGKLVAICADGPRQREQLKPIATTYEELPEGSFAAQGTNVRTAIIVIDK